MSEVISVYSTVAQAEGFDIEVNESLLLQNRYFPTSDGDMFAGKEVLFDFIDKDLEKGVYLTTTYKDNKKVNWVAKSVEPPRVAESDTVDPTSHDRVVFERLCREMGADLNRSEAYQNLLALKASRQAARVYRSVEELCSHVLKNGAIQFSQAHDNSANPDYDTIDVKYFGEDGANNHALLSATWGSNSATPYKDICNMVTEMSKNGSVCEDLLIGGSAWMNLYKDELFQKQFTAIHTEQSVLFGKEIEKAVHVGVGLFAGVPLNIIVDSSAYKAKDGRLVQYIDPYAVILISPEIGRTLCGACVLLNPSSIGYGYESTFMDGRGKVIESIYKDFDKQTVNIRAESRPLPAPKQPVNNLPWMYCDTAIANGDSSVNEIKFGAVPEIKFEAVTESGEALEGATLPDGFNSLLGGTSLSLTAPTKTGYTFSKYMFDGAEWDGLKVPKYSGTVQCVFVANS